MRQKETVITILLLCLLISLFWGSCFTDLAPQQNVGLAAREYTTNRVVGGICQSIANGYTIDNNSGNLYEQENATNRVEITSISFSKDKRNPVGIYYDFLFNITVENRGINDVNGLILDINFINHTLSYYRIRFFETNCKNVSFSLAVKEARTFQASILLPLDSALLLGTKPPALVDVTVKRNGVVLNEACKAFPDGPTVHSTYHAKDDYTTVYYPAEIPPPKIQPIVTINSPTNNTTIISNNLPLIFNLTLEAPTSYPITLVELYYKFSWKSNNITIDTNLETPFMKTILPVIINASDIPEGAQSITFYATVSYEYETGREPVVFSPSQIYAFRYVYVYSEFFQTTDCSSVNFTVTQPQESEVNASTPVVVTVAASVIAVGAGLTIYLKKRRP